MEQKKLPDAEFEIMKAIWQMQEPVTSAMVTERLRSTLPAKDWKPQTILTMLTRLEQKAFLRSEKHGKEREYYVLIPQQDYLQIEASSFRQRFSGGRPVSSAPPPVLYHRGRQKESPEADKL